MFVSIGELLPILESDADLRRRVNLLSVLTQEEIDEREKVVDVQLPIL